MFRWIAASILGAAIVLPAGTVSAAYRIEHVYWGNLYFGSDRIYVLDPASGRRMVLSRRWGRLCGSHAALNYGFGGGCWHPVRESYSDRRRKPRGWLWLKP